ncbi:MAG: hypothetical protein ACE5FO_02970, partial [Parvularculaceae bacterium]
GIGSNLPYDFFNSQELFVADITGDGMLDVIGGDRLNSRAGSGAVTGFGILAARRFVNAA